MKIKITNENTTELKNNEVFVFGSNLSGKQLKKRHDKRNHNTHRSNGRQTKLLNGKTRIRRLQG